MRTDWRRVLACGVSLFLGTSVARAQLPGGAGNRPIRVIVSGGFTLPAGDLKDFSNTGYHYDASLLLTIPGFPVSLRPEVSLTRFSLKDVQGASISGYGSSDTQMLGALGSFEIPLAGGLYVMAGGGLMNLKTSDVSGDLSQSRLAVNAGAGLRFRLGGASGFLEARVGSASYDEGKMGFSKAQFIPITFGLIF